MLNTIFNKIYNTMSDKIKLFISLFTFFSFLLSIPVGFADDGEIESIKKNMATILPANMAIDSVELSSMEGAYIVNVGTQSMFVYNKGDFVLVGDVYDVNRKVNLSDELKDQKIAKALESIPEDEMILMGEQTERYVTVFTDTDCFYCQKFHKTIPELQSRGMQVRYLMFPRAGLQSDSYNEAVSVWCSENQPEAMTIAKAGGTVAPHTCENPVAGQYQLGQRIGVRGTPTMILDTGKVIPGFLPPEKLLSEAGMIN